MSKKTYKRLDLAINQFETTILLFLTGEDKFSVITLAGAADVIFSELVMREGKENFTDHIAKTEDEARSRQAVGKEVNDLLYINALKHFDPGDDEHLSFNVNECAIGAIYNALKNEKSQLVKAFIYWVRNNLDLKKYNLD